MTDYTDEEILHSANIEITKHYKIEDNMLKQEGIDY